MMSHLDARHASRQVPSYTTHGNPQERLTIGIDWKRAHTMFDLVQTSM